VNVLNYMPWYVSCEVRELLLYSSLHLSSLVNIKSRFQRMVQSFLFSRAAILLIKSKAIPLHATEALGRRSDIAPTHS
jgi:hypothetical protein